MRTYKAEGIILSRRNFSESDRIITLLTKYHGKISAIAKGVRKIKSKKAPHLDQLSHSQLLLAKGKDLDLVIEASLIETFPQIKKNLYASVTALYGAELVNALTSEREEAKSIFLLFLDFLREAGHLEDLEKLNLLRLAFETKLLFALGFWSKRSFKIEKKAGAILNLFQDISLKEAGNIKIKNIKELDTVLRREIEEIAEKQLKSPKILSTFYSYK